MGLRGTQAGWGGGLSVVGWGLAVAAVVMAVLVVTVMVGVVVAVAVAVMRAGAFVGAVGVCGGGGVGEVDAVFG